MLVACEKLERIHLEFFCQRRSGPSQPAGTLVSHSFNAFNCNSRYYMNLECPQRINRLAYEYGLLSACEGIMGSIESMCPGNARKWAASLIRLPSDQKNVIRTAASFINAFECSHLLHTPFSMVAASEGGVRLI